MEPTLDLSDQGLAPHTVLVLEEWAPYAEGVLDEWLEGALIESRDGYVYVGEEDAGFKISLKYGIWHTHHHGAFDEISGDLLDLFQEIFGIADQKRACC